MSASVVAALAALFALVRTEREWPAFPVYAANLDFGPVLAGGLLEQTLVAPPTPLREIKLHAIPPWPDTVIVRIREAHQPSDGVLLELTTRVLPDGSIRLRIPGTLDTSRRSLRVQVVNPPDSSAPLTLQANRGDAYPNGRALAHDDPGDGRVDLVLQAWRRITPAAAALELWRAHIPGAVFVIWTVGIAAVGGFTWLRRRLAKRPLPALLTASLLLLTAGLLAARMGFAVLAPWLA